MRINPAAAVVLGAAALMTSACVASRAASPVPGGDPGRGAAAITRYGCSACHTIAGIRTARSLVGPPLTGIRDRMYIAGMLQNNPENLVQWIRDPKQVNPNTAMPNLGLSTRDATDIAAYLYSIP